MPRWKHRPPYRISYQYDCNFAKRADTLEEALEVARSKHTRSLIGVHVELEFEGTKKIGSVGIIVQEADGKTLEEVFDLFDKEGDAYIACRAQIGRWHHSENVT